MTSGGVNASERYLSRLAEKGFLSLWSHPNLYRDIGKELADLTVACHNVILLFSDKRIKFDDTVPLEISWPRWYKKAVFESTKQLRRAERWIQNHPDRVFRDVQCQSRVELFSSVDYSPEIHKIAVANGASAACINYFGGGSGALIAYPEADPASPGFFCVGNPARDGTFVHVFDEANLNVVLSELDTITDFVDYLRERRRVFEEEILIVSPSEEDMLAVYLKDTGEDGRHAFVTESGKAAKSGDNLVIQEGSYQSYRKRPEYKRKKKADKKSYYWDTLIERFAHNFRAGTLMPVPEVLSGIDGRHGGVEIGLRYMALEPRIQRRGHSDAILGAFDTLRKSGVNRFFRCMQPPVNDQNQTCFFILLLNRAGVLGDLTYDEYRQIRASTAHAYAQNLLLRNPRFRRVIGIATEGELGGRRSEDLVYQEPPEWTSELVAETERLADVHEVFRNFTQRAYSTLEYPETDLGLKGGYSEIPYRYLEPMQANQPSVPGLNRAERRKNKALMRKSKNRRTNN